MKRSLGPLLLVALASAARAQVPERVGGEFRVNGYTMGSQGRPGVAAGPGGRFMVVWSSDYHLDGSGQALVGRLVDNLGGPVGAEFRINQYTTSDQTSADVAAAPDGYLVTWTSDGQDGWGSGVFMRPYDANGLPRGPELQVNTYTTRNQVEPRVTSIPGGFLVVWNSDGTERGRVFNTVGAPVTGDFVVAGPASQSSPVAAGLPDGGFVVAWRREQYVMFQRYTTAGPAGPITMANTPFSGNNDRTNPSIVADALGQFYITWRWVTGIAGKDILRWDEVGTVVRAFDANGTPQAFEAPVDAAPMSFSLDARLGGEPSGRMLAAWTSALGQFYCWPTPCPPMVSQDGSGASVYARWLQGSSPLSSEFRVNTFTTGDQARPALAWDTRSNVLVVWHSYQDGSDSGIYGQWFGGGVLPAGLVADPVASAGSDGNGVLEPRETAQIAPAWRNATGASQAMAGVALSFTGPAPGLYGVADGSASYGVVPAHTTATCGAQGDCYVVATDGTRPAVHWDAFLQEAVAADLAQPKRWTVHLGDSFGDVPRSSPFYRFVETLLHRGITAGCAAAQYCPSATTSREQMPVFVLVAREGADYVPVACGTPIFADVPAGSPFCRWIEELARRGVVGGCGVGLYCPEAAVTREQMAVFLLRTLDPALDPPACTTPIFADVPAGSPFCRWIEELARRGVVTGCGGGNYCPAAAVTREQMGAFIGVTFGLTLYGP